MKKNISLILLLFLSLGAWSQQTYTQKIGANDRVVIKFHNAEMKVVAHNSAEIKIEALNYKAPPERAKGLRPLYNTAMDNTNIGLQLEKIEGGYEIKEASRQDGKYIIRVPASAKLSIEEMHWGSEDIIIEGMRSEIEVKSRNANVNLKNVSGPVIVNSTSGDIVIDFSSFSQAGPSSINAISGDVDIKVPANAKANFTLSSISGEIYTDLDLKLAKSVKEEKEERNSYSYTYSSASSDDGETPPNPPQVWISSPSDFPGRAIKATANGGGANLTIRATSADIYLRKK